MSREAVERIRAGDRTGRPVGSDQFIERVGLELGRTLARQKRGRKPGPNRRAAFGVQG